MKVLILGGAGFIGSNLAEDLCQDHEVTVIDGLMPETGGSNRNLEKIREQIRYIPRKLDEVPDLSELLAQQSFIVDSMAWTAHLSAMEKPSYDLELNQSSHLRLLEALKMAPGKKLLYLGSRSQYGSLNTSEITEETCLSPVDIQGIHKVATESYYRVLSKARGLRTLSLRIPNTFGQNQPVRGADIGLVGSMIRDALNGQTLHVYGTDRYRHLLYVKDLCKTVRLLVAREWSDFEAFNIAGHRLSIKELAEQIIRLAGQGSCSLELAQPHIQSIDPGSATISDVKLRKTISEIPTTPIPISLGETIQYFRKRESL